MFTPYKPSMSRKEINKHKEWVNDIYRHISHVNVNLTNEETQENVLRAIGLIEHHTSLLDYKEFLNKHLKEINVSDFVQRLHVIHLKHEHNEQCPVSKFCITCRTNIQNLETTKEKPKIIDLFCGAGGMSLGFVQEGFQIAFANDIEESCLLTYGLNHPEVPQERIILEDVQDLSNRIREHVEEDIDVVIGGPPCQGFSTANRQRMIDDPRNKLYKEYVNVVKEIQPKFFVMENVIGMNKIASEVVEDFSNVGYNVHHEVLDAWEFGVPQKRRRIIFIGNRIGIDNARIFELIHLNNEKIDKTNLFDAIGNLPELEPLRIKHATDYESEESGFFVKKQNPTDSIANEYLSQINNGREIHHLYNHKSRYNNDRDIEIFSRLNQGDDSLDPKIADIMPYKSRKEIFRDKYFKMVYDLPSKTITAHMRFDCNMYIHPTQSRGLTPREAARIQSYPDDYYFKGPYTKTYMQIGNSVPPLMARGIANIIKTKLK